MRFNSGKFGASSPERERKLMSLAESSVPQSRKATKVSKSSYSLSVAASQSPGPSPGQARREERGGAAGGSSSRSHERSHSDTPPVPVGKSAGGQLVHLHVPRSCFASSLCHREPARASKATRGFGSCSSLVLYGIRAPIIEPFRAWKPTILMTADASNTLKLSTNDSRVSLDLDQ